MFPKSIKPFGDHSLELIWHPTENKVLVPYLDLRFACPCASCVDEHTGRRMIKKEDLDPHVRVTHVQLIGQYAFSIHFSDGHKTGIFSFDTLSSFH